MKTNFNICTVVQGKDLETFLKNLKKAQASANMVELRADSVNDFGADDLSILKESLKVPSIFTFRHKKEGGLFMGTPSKQKKILQEAFTSGFSYVDVSFDNAVLKTLSEKDKKHLLLSYHNNKETPSLKALEVILSEMRAIRPAVIKIATFVNNPKDVTILVSLLKQKRKKEKMIVIGMGKKGKTTRLEFPAMGSYMAYVSMKGDKSIAPGMLTEEDLKPIIKNLKK